MTSIGDSGPDISIIIPVYNLESYLDRCLETLKHLGDVRAEIICINDGSTDGSLHVLERHARTNPAIRIISQSNQGCAAARQAGLESASGTYVGFVDGDDWVAPGMFQTLFAQAQLHDADIAMGDYVKEYAVTGEAEPIVDNFASFRLIDGSGAPAGWVTPLDVLSVAPSIWRKIFRRQFLSRFNIRFDPRIPRFDDLLFNAEVFFRQPSVIYVPGPTYHYLLQRPGQTVQAQDRRLFVHFDIFEAMSQTCARLGQRDIERAFRGIQLRTHPWINGLLQDELRSEYRAKAAADVFGRKLLLSPSEILDVAKAIGPRSEKYAERLWKQVINAERPAARGGRWQDFARKAKGYIRSAR